MEETYIAIRKVEVFDVGEFPKGTKWVGGQYTHNAWKLKLEGTDKYYYFNDKGMKKFFQKVEQ